MKTLFFLLLAGLYPCLALGQTNTNWTEVNLAVTDHQVIPRYAEFKTAASRLGAVALAFCDTASAGQLASYQAVFHAAMDAWQTIQHLQFGPITYFNWNFRLQYWPDESGIGARQLNALIAARDERVLQSENFARESVAVQGFPALERLLFARGALQDFQADPFRCRVAQTISQNISAIAADVYALWSDEFRTVIANADTGDFFEDARDATIDYLKAQVEPARRIQQQKLENVLDASFPTAQIRRAESWRSERSLRNIKLNVEALARLFNGSGTDPVLLNGVLLAEDVRAINDGLDELRATLDLLPDSMRQVLETEAGYARVRTAAEQFEALFELFEKALKNTDLYLGFNSLDGD